MRVLLLSPWDNAWVLYFKAEFEKRGWTFSFAKKWDGGHQDLVLHGWANGLTKPVPNAKNVMFLRRYELFEGGLSKVEWSGIDHLICVNTWIAERVKETFATNGVSTPVSVIYNGTDQTKWTYKFRDHGHKIGMACHVHPKKNLPLAVQILAMLPEDYELHIAGGVQDACTAEYLHNLAQKIRRKVYFYNQVPHEEMDLWWEQMNYCLSTSISEGNPNNVIEAMAKGIKPVIHNWPGVEDQFPRDIRFSSIADAVSMIHYEQYDSPYYRDIVEEKFSLKNYSKVADLCLGSA